VGGLLRAGGKPCRTPPAESQCHVKLLPLKESGFGGGLTKRLELLSVEYSVHNNQHVHMTKRGMVVMDGSDPGNFFMYSFCQRLHGFFGYFPQMQIPPGVFPDGIRIDDNFVKHTPLLSITDQTVGLLPGHSPAGSKQCPGDFDSVPARPLFNVSDVLFGFFCPSRKFGFDNRHSWIYSDCFS
jgi:hypothetical protein